MLKNKINLTAIASIALLVGAAACSKGGSSSGADAVDPQARSTVNAADDAGNYAAENPVQNVAEAPAQNPIQGPEQGPIQQPSPLPEQPTPAPEQPTPMPTPVEQQPTPAPSPIQGPTPAPSPIEQPTPMPSPIQGPPPAPTPVEQPTPMPSPIQGPTPAPSPVQGGRVISVSATHTLRFEPETINIRVGDTVEWTNTSRMQHTVTDDPSRASNPAHAILPPGAGAFNSGILDPGLTFRHTFTVPGLYKYFCIPHEGRAMVGTINVSE